MHEEINHHAVVDEVRQHCRFLSSGDEAMLIDTFALAIPAAYVTAKPRRKDELVDRDATSRPDRIVWRGYILVVALSMLIWKMSSKEGEARDGSYEFVPPLSSVD